MQDALLQYASGLAAPQQPTELDVGQAPDLLYISHKSFKRDVHCDPQDAKFLHF